MCASTIYYLVIFLQIARAKVRLYELPWEPSLSNGLVILAIVSPLFLGMLAVGTMGWGAIPVALLTAWGLAKSDKGRSIQ